MSDYIIITCILETHSNTCDSSYVDQFVLARTRSGDYNNCAHQYLKEIMIQMAIDPFVNVRVMIELLQKALSSRNIIDRHMINNVRIRTRKKRLELDYANIDIYSKHFDTTYITSYQDTADNCSKSKLIRL